MAVGHQGRPGPLGHAQQHLEFVALAGNIVRFEERESVIDQLEVMGGNTDLDGAAAEQ